MYIAHLLFLFFFNDTATTKIYTSVHTLSLHDALPISTRHRPVRREPVSSRGQFAQFAARNYSVRSEEHTSELHSRTLISYAVFCLKKKNSCAASKLRLPILAPSPLSTTHRPSHFFFFNDTATTEIYTSVHTLSLHDALPIPASRSRVTSKPVSSIDRPPLE